MGCCKDATVYDIAPTISALYDLSCESDGRVIHEILDGVDIGTYVEKHPEDINEIFMQTIEGFAYLEECNVLHRDIRPLNILVSDKDGIVKIIDFGFGKRIAFEEDFDIE